VLGIDRAAVARVLTLIGTRQGGEWVLPGGAVARWSERAGPAGGLLIRGAGAPEGSGLGFREGGSEITGSPHLGVRCVLRSDTGADVRSLVIEKRPEKGTALPVEVRF